MEVDETIEFLLSEGARLDARQQEFHRQLRLLARLGVVACRQLSQSQRRLADQVGEQQRRTEASLDRLAEQQRETEANLNTLILLFEQHLGGNGHTSPPANH